MSLDDLQPVTITRSRYGGTYEVGDWVAFAASPDRLPIGWDGDDVDCAEFWADHAHGIGGGATPAEAYADLGRRSADDDAVERGRGVADPDVDLVADRGHPRAVRQEQHRGLHVRRLGEQPLLAVDRERRPHEAGRVQAAAGQRSRPARAGAASPVGASRPMPCAVPPLTTRMCPALGAVRPR